MQEPGDEVLDAIDEASRESFPASDPPARGGAHAAPSAASIAAAWAEPEVARASSTFRRIAIVAAAIGMLFLLARRFRERYA